jgi:hypothetical protein
MPVNYSHPSTAAPAPAGATVVDLDGTPVTGSYMEGP